MTNRSSLASAVFSAAASLTALAVALPSSAAAAMPGATVSVKVPTRDLDLASDAGRATLDQRLRSAAIEACGDASSADPEGKRVVRQCRTKLVRAGQQQALALTSQQDRLAAR
ncbi:MAG TPA: UrcA family protein [Sphingomicrobium sp.]|jgi:UrcA family protein|nr:UrcA family protein [Sphingomicrobium sp.]